MCTILPEIKKTIVLFTYVKQRNVDDSVMIRDVIDLSGVPNSESFIEKLSKKN